MRSFFIELNAVKMTFTREGGGTTIFLSFFSISTAIKGRFWGFAFYYFFYRGSVFWVCFFVIFFYRGSVFLGVAFLLFFYRGSVFGGLSYFYCPKRGT